MNHARVLKRGEEVYEFYLKTIPKPLLQEFLLPNLDIIIGS
jgi:hypothetical protein